MCRVGCVLVVVEPCWLALKRHQNENRRFLLLLFCFFFFGGGGFRCCFETIRGIYIRESMGTLPAKWLVSDESWQGDPLLVQQVKQASKHILSLCRHQMPCNPIKKQCGLHPFFSPGSDWPLWGGQIQQVHACDCRQGSAEKRSPKTRKPSRTVAMMLQERILSARAFQHFLAPFE